MFETLKLLKNFYFNYTKGKNLYHKFCTYTYYLIFNFFAYILGRNEAKYIFRN